MALLIKPDASELEVKPSNGEYFTLRELYNLLGCDTVERVSLNGKYALVVDEEGKLHDPPSPHNRYATTLALGVLRPGDYISGNAVLVEEFFVPDEDGGDTKWR